MSKNFFLKKCPDISKNVKKIHKEDVVLMQMEKFDYAYHLSHQLTKVANWLRTVTKSCKINRKFHLKCNKNFRKK